MYVSLLSPTKSQISVVFAQRSAVFGVTRHFETSPLNDPKMIIDATKSKAHNIHVVLLFPSPKFHSVPYYTTACFPDAI